MQHHCKRVAVTLQMVCSSFANGLQHHCKLSSAILQTVDKKSAISLRQCRKLMALLQTDTVRVKKNAAYQATPYS